MNACNAAGVEVRRRAGSGEDHVARYEHEQPVALARDERHEGHEGHEGDESHAGGDGGEGEGGVVPVRSERRGLAARVAQLEAEQRRRSVSVGRSTPALSIQQAPWCRDGGTHNQEREGAMCVARQERQEQAKVPPQRQPRLQSDQQQQQQRHGHYLQRLGHLVPSQPHEARLTRSGAPAHAHQRYGQQPLHAGRSQQPHNTQRRSHPRPPGQLQVQRHARAPVSSMKRPRRLSGAAAVVEACRHNDTRAVRVLLADPHLALPVFLPTAIAPPHTAVAAVDALAMLHGDSQQHDRALSHNPNPNPNLSPVVAPVGQGHTLLDLVPPAAAAGVASVGCAPDDVGTAWLAGVARAICAHGNGEMMALLADKVQRQLRLPANAGLPLSDSQRLACLTATLTLSDECSLVQLVHRLVPLNGTAGICMPPPTALLLRAAAEGHLRLCQLLCALGAQPSTLLQFGAAWDEPTTWPPERVAAFHGWLARVADWPALWIAVDAGFTDVARAHLRAGTGGGSSPVVRAALPSLLRATQLPYTCTTQARETRETRETRERREAREKREAMSELRDVCCRAALGGWRPETHVVAPRPLRRLAFVFLLALRRLAVKRADASIAGVAPLNLAKLVLRHAQCDGGTAVVSAQYEQQGPSVPCVLPQLAAPLHARRVLA